MNSDLESAFRLDGLATSHPVQVDVNHPNEINEIFDSISYNKVTIRDWFISAGIVGIIP